MTREELLQAIREASKEILSTEFKTQAERMEKIEKVVADISAKMKEVEPQRKSAVADVDKKEIRSFRIKDYLTRPAINEEVKEFQELNDSVVLMSQILKKDPRELKLYKELQMRAKILDESAGAGAEWIPTIYSESLFEKIQLELRVAKLHNWIPMKSPTYKIPVNLHGLTAYRGTAGQDISSLSSDITTANKTLDAVKFIVYTSAVDELTEDALFPVIDILKKEIARAIAEGVEDAIINGDTAGTMDANVGSNDVKLNFNGYRKICPSSAKYNVNGLPTAEDILNIRKKMGKYALEPSKYVWVVSINTYFNLIALKKETGESFFRELGPKDPQIVGELAKMHGAPVIVSEKVREDLNDSGVFDNNTKDKTIILCVRPDHWLGGLLRDVTVWVDRKVETQSHVLSASYRAAFVNMLDDEAIVAIGYNVSY